MVTIEKRQRLFFLINPGSGHKNKNLQTEIESFYRDKMVDLVFFVLSENCSRFKIEKAIHQSNADKVIAVGGDGTLKLVAEILVNTPTPIGIIPTGSANGMAKELHIPLDLCSALDLIIAGKTKQIHAVRINDELCIHLSDIGFNAYIVKRFNELPERGMWTYAKAAWAAFWAHKKMEVAIKIGNELMKQKAAMVVIANATRYGSGFQINPNGKLDDDLFEVILVKEYAVMEIIKIWISKLPWDKNKIESFQVKELTITTKHKVNFQVDGEYLGKVNTVQAKIILNAITLIVPN